MNDQQVIISIIIIIIIIIIIDSSSGLTLRFDTKQTINQYFIQPVMTYFCDTYIDGILPKGSCPPCLHMADRTLLAGYPRCM